MLTRELDRLHAALDETPGDLDTRRVLSDVYEELGDTRRASYHRRLVQERKWPWLCNPLEYEGYLEKHWYWFTSISKAPNAEISSMEYVHFPAKEKGPEPRGNFFGTRMEAEEALFRVWDQLKEKGR